MQHTQIECPNCHSIIDVQDVLSHQLEEKLKKEFQQKLDSERSLLSKMQEELEKSRRDFEEKKKEEERIFEERLKAKLKEETLSLENDLRNKIIEQ